jgi:hypothetical protein
MLLDKSQYRLDFDVEFLFERPVGWSSACLDSTIDYYLDCTSTDLETERVEKNSHLIKEN